MFPQISYWAFRDGLSGRRSVVETMRLAREAGFEGIELAVSAVGELTPCTPPEVCRDLAREAAALGLRLGSVATGLFWGANPASADPLVRAHALDIGRNSLAVTAALGAKHFLVVPGAVDIFFDPKAEVVPYDLCYKRALAFCRSLARTAEKTGVTVCAENVWNKFLLSPLEFRGFLRAVGSRYVGAYFDVGNVWQYGYPQDWIRILGRAIKRVHVKDFRRAVGTADGFCQLGDGDVPLAESLALLKRIGYRGPVTAEVFPGPTDTDEPAFLRTVAARLKHVMPGGAGA
jgi:hexulose-6-phosphate isomerase